MITILPLRMKKLSLTLFLFSLLIISNAQISDNEKTIQDYFDLLKVEWICEFSDSYEKVVDIRNGYLVFKSKDNEMEPIFQMALFKDIKENDLIVIHIPGYACADIFDCPATEGRKTYFLKYKEDWKDVSGIVMPPIVTEHFYADSISSNIVDKYASHAVAYELPRYGQTMKLALEICDDYINFDYPDDPVVSDEQIERLLKERKTLSLQWNKSLGVFEWMK